MALQYEGLNCPRLELALKKGARLGIFRDGDTSLLSRLQNNQGLITSEVSTSLVVLLKKTNWQLEPDKLRYTMPTFKERLERSALEQLVEKGYFLGLDAHYDLLNGYIIDPNKNIVSIKKTLKDISTLLQLMELEAIKYL